MTGLLWGMVNLNFLVKCSKCHRHVISLSRHHCIFDIRKEVDETRKLTEFYGE